MMNSQSKQKQGSAKDPQTPSSARLPDRAVDLAGEILTASRRRESREERSQRSKMAAMMGDLNGKRFTTALSDQVLRIIRPERAVLRLVDLLRELGCPRYLGPWERCLLGLGARMGRMFPSLVMPLVAREVRQQSRHVVLPGEEKPLSGYLQQRVRSGARVNVNHLGEAVLGEREAERRLEAVLGHLANPEIDYVSVKISSIVSQINLVAYRETLELIKSRLRRLYAAAAGHGGERGPKFVNLDMEEYRDLHLTVDAFREVLEEEPFERLEAGIVLQAYLPDSFGVLKSLTAWAKLRHARSGGRIKVRLVKGANLSMERVEASLHGWPLAPYGRKLEVDANYKRMLRYACCPEHTEAVRVGVASHNLFDAAYALLLREEAGVGDGVEFEMLEGMVNAQAMEVKERSGGMLFYAPVVKRENFQNAIAYLVRRLEENTAPQNFLCDLFGLEVGSPAWAGQRGQFLESCALAESGELSSVPNRDQDRHSGNLRVTGDFAPFNNEPDTDFSLPVNVRWIREVVDRWRGMELGEVPIQVGGSERVVNCVGEGRDPSVPGVVAYRYSLAGAGEVEEAIRCAVRSQPGWQAEGIAGRAHVLKRAAALFAERRGETIGCMMRDGGKPVLEADGEVSEAVDFANYYARSLDGEGWGDGVVPEGLGVVLVTPPWNFPYAIPAGGCLAGLMAGNAVILKPAPETVLTAWTLAKQLWEAGVPREVLQFLPVPEDEVGRGLITDDRIGALILTGAYETARLFQGWKPGLNLYAETSGKNALIITAAADLDLAIKDLVKSAFGHAGQKCSAASLAVVEREVYDDPAFRRQLKDAVESLACGASWDLRSVVTPLIREPAGALSRALTTLDEGESWLVQPEMREGNPRLWSPGVKLGVRSGSWYQRTECFGPVLGLVAVEDLEEALRVQNSGEFGLTGGLHSLDPKEIARWREAVEVGNGYVNRGTTGAIVRRQPFGGWKRSAVGTGTKAGGPNYVAAFCRWRERGLPGLVGPVTGPVQALIAGFGRLSLGPEPVRVLKAAAGSCAHWWEAEFSRTHDPSQIRGESNEFRYRPRSRAVLRLEACSGEETKLRAFMAVAACLSCGVPVQISVGETPAWIGELGRLSGGEVVVETQAGLGARLGSLENTIVRVVGVPTDELLSPAHAAAVPVHAAEVCANGRVELVRYLREQSLTETVHRYGELLR